MTHSFIVYHGDTIFTARRPETLVGLWRKVSLDVSHCGDKHTMCLSIELADCPRMFGFSVDRSDQKPVEVVPRNPGQNRLDVVWLDSIQKANIRL